jgi:hypothetical protein
MIQFNLLPDVKLEYIKARRLKRMVIVLSTATAAASIALLVILFLVVGVFQKQHLNNLSADIKKESSQLQDIPDLNKILTIQNQLNSLPALQTQAPLTSRLFNYVQQSTPNTLSISSLTVDVANHTVSIQGKADSLETVNKYVDTMKFTKYSVAGDDAQKNLFSETVLSSFNRDDKTASYTIDSKFSEAWFDSTNGIKLDVPQGLVTTRSETQKPSSVFQGGGQ